MRKLRIRLSAAIAIAVLLPTLVSCAQKEDMNAHFTWDNATVYFLLTDRFCNGSTDNDHAYGRGLDQNGDVIAAPTDKALAETYAAGSFHGGDFAGITKKIREGYFTDLGINAIWITPPFEQIHGFRSGDGFAFYAYHGYWALDYTQPDANYGTPDEFRELVDTAHKSGIRILLDVVLNHPGYATMQDAAEYGFGEYKDGWESYYYGDPKALSGDREQGYQVTASKAWQRWWGVDWIRSNDPFTGYDKGGAESEDTLLCVSGLPDFKNESEKQVALPPILAAKWEKEGRLKQEQAELDAFFTENKLAPTVLNHQIKWLTDWVRDYGIDGFRCDTAKHVELSAWAKLEKYATAAFVQWRAENPSKVLDDTPFWMTGEVWDHGVTKDKYFTDGGFDALINFSFRKNAVNEKSIPALYSFMSESLNKDAGFNMLSYLSSHDTAMFTRTKLIDGGSMLLMAPGAVQIYYGDETARPKAYEENPYEDLRLRSDMNWDSMDSKVLLHWQKLGQFRARHPAVGAGEHMKLCDSPYAFSRTYEANGETDKVIVAFTDAGQQVTTSVSGIFDEGTTLRNAYDGAVAVVRKGTVTFNGGENGIILLEQKK